MKKRFWKKLSYNSLSSDTLLISWPDAIAPNTLLEILALETAISDLKIDGVKEIFHSYSSIAVYFDISMINAQTLIKRIKSLDTPRMRNSPTTTWTLPVCYHEAFAIDILPFCKEKGYTHEEVIQKHKSRDYLVYMMGFMPGFMYLGGLDQSLNLPRKNTPTRCVEKGDVAIGGAQTGIYPLQSPGGWHVIGNCPVPLFDPASSTPCFIQSGDKAKFRAICIEEHKIIKIQLSTGIFDFNSLRNG